MEYFCLLEKGEKLDLMMVHPCVKLCRVPPPPLPQPSNYGMADPVVPERGMGCGRKEEPWCGYKWKWLSDDWGIFYLKLYFWILLGIAGTSGSLRTIDLPAEWHRINQLPTCWAFSIFSDPKSTLAMSIAASLLVSLRVLLGGRLVQSSSGN